MDTIDEEAWLTECELGWPAEAYHWGPNQVLALDEEARAEFMAAWDDR